MQNRAGQGITGSHDGLGTIGRAWAAQSRVDDTPEVVDDGIRWCRGGRHGVGKAPCGQARLQWAGKAPEYFDKGCWWRRGR